MCDPPFPRMTYAEAMERFGNDKPDLRFAMELKNLTAAFAGTSFKVFAEILARGESVYGINLSADHAIQPPRARRTYRIGESAPRNGTGVCKSGRGRMAGADRKISKRRRASRRIRRRRLERPATLC